MKHSPPKLASERKSRLSVYSIFAAATVLAASLSGCGEGEVKASTTKAQVTSAKWDDSAKLVAKGTAPASQEVVLRNAGTNGVLGTAKANASGQWTLTAQLPSPPCEVVADTSRTNATAPVAVAGATKATCTRTAPSTLQSARAIRANAIVRAAATLPEPNGVIVSPASNGQAIQLIVNDSLSFAAVGSAPGTAPPPDGGPLTPLSYSWNFDGAAPNAIVQNPGLIRFSRAGVFNVRLTVANRLGIPDSTPSERTIIVTNPAQTTLAALTAVIASPVGDTTIPVGGVVNFDATASGGTAPYKFIWNFGGAGPSSNAQTPGSVTFTRAGTFIVRLTVEDSAVPPERFATPLQVTITVANSTTAANQPPTGVILSPATDLTIVSGDTVFFQGTAIDPDNNTPMTYAWDFGGGAPVSIEQNPGLIAFANTSSTPVVYTVKMVASDALAAVDANPPTRTITVNSVGTATAHMPIVAIIDPIADVQVNVGTPVRFAATATSPDPAAVLELLWSFAGVAPDSIELIPPPVTFNTAGEYLITFTAIDTVSALSSTVERLITVIDPNAPTPPPVGSGPGAPFEAEIDQPRGRIKIQPGDSIEFAGSVELPLNAVGDPAAYTYAWTFPGGDPAESMEQIPGAVMFLDPGHFDVTLVVTEIATGIVSEPEDKHIFVGDVNAPPPGAGTGAGTGAGPGAGAGTAPAPNPAAPTASIDSPTGDVTIMLGDTIEFLGSGTDPNGLTLAYRWSFGSNMPGSTVQNPGNVTFDKVGVFNVKLEVTNPNGLEGQARMTVTVDAPPPAPGAAPLAIRRR